MQEDDKQRQKERDREALIRQYTLPDNPTILVHPSPTAKSGKFECTVMSLSLLLDYRPEDNKEHVFEVRNTHNKILEFLASCYYTQGHLFSRYNEIINFSISKIYRSFKI